MWIHNHVVPVVQTDVLNAASQNSRIGTVVTPVATKIIRFLLLQHHPHASHNPPNAPIAACIQFPRLIPKPILIYLRPH